MERLWTAMDADTGPTVRPRSRVLACLFAAALVGVGYGAHLALSDHGPDSRAYVLFFVPSIFAATALGGLWPGLFATGLAAASIFALPARFHIAGGSIADFSLFVAFGIAIAVGGQLLLSIQQRVLEANRHLARREAHLRLILGTVPDAMIAIDARGVIQAFGPVAEQMFGYRVEEVLGRNVSVLMPSPDREAHDGYLARYAQTGERRIIGIGRVVLGQRKDGTTFAAELCVGEMQPSGQTFFTGFLRDLTEKQRTESRLQLLQSELVHISRLSAMGEMVATLAHELNQPLSAIANYLKGGQRLLEAENPDSRAITPISRAAEQSLRAGQIIRRLRDFVSRGETERKVESLPQLIEEVSGLGLLGAKERGVSVRLERDPAVDSVLVDRIQIQQVLLNLLRNALEAMDGGRRELMISIERTADGMAQVSVADSGAGISPDIADRLFQPFVSGKGSQGMGVGLSICRTIIEAHGGRIWAEPNRGGGTIFRFTVPRAEMREAVA